VSNRSWIWLGVTYVGLYLLVMGVERHGFDRGPLSPADKIFFAPIVWGVAAHGIQSGSFRGRFSWVDRDEQPFSFWTTITFEILYGIFMFGWGIRDALR
jgi:hypothetical protein